MTLFSENNFAVHCLGDNVFFTENKTVATDRISLVEISAIEAGGEQIAGAMKGFKPFMINGKHLSDLKLDKYFPYAGVKHLSAKEVSFIDAAGNTRKFERQAGKFPDYERVCFGNPAKAEAILSVKHLEGILKIAKKVGNNVKIKIGRADQPVVIINHNGRQNLRAAIMPIKE